MSIAESMGCFVCSLGMRVPSGVKRHKVSAVERAGVGTSGVVVALSLRHDELLEIDDGAVPEVLLIVDLEGRESLGRSSVTSLVG